MAAITNEDIFGDDEAPEPASVIIPGSPSENSATSDENNSPSSVKTKGTAPSRERLTMQQKLFAWFRKIEMQHGVLTDDILRTKALEIAT